MIPQLNPIAQVEQWRNQARSSFHGWGSVFGIAILSDPKWLEIDHIRFRSRTPPTVTFGLRSSVTFGNLRYRRFHQPSVFGTEGKTNLRSTPTRNHKDFALAYFFSRLNVWNNAKINFPSWKLEFGPKRRIFLVARKRRRREKVRRMRRRKSTLRRFRLFTDYNKKFQWCVCNIVIVSATLYMHLQHCKYVCDINT